ncbi:TRAP transporter small permease [Devosia honganensis]|uniref:TRAP transporter small permease protein n=1 Tax=Devosia honganensis TaxID=1610527 RepID=A0ABV7WXX7_9HYPH
MSDKTFAHPRYEACRAAMAVVNDWATKLAGLLLGGMVAAIAVSVSVRLLYSYSGIRLSAPWTEEVARYLMVASVFLGGAVAAFQKRLIGVDAFVSMMPSRLARWMRAFAHLLTLGFALLIVWQAAALVEFGLRQWSPVMRMPMAFVYAWILLGAALMAANTVLHMIGEIIGAEGLHDVEIDEDAAEILSHQGTKP